MQRSRNRARTASAKQRLGGLLGAAACLLMAGPGWASSGGWIHASVTPFQVGIAPAGAQLFHEETAVYGLRLSLLYVTNKRVGGLDLGLFGDAERMDGLQVGVGNQVLGELHGVQLGFANSADHGGGLQIGVLNKTHDLQGLQIGLINWNDEGFLPVFPLFNFSVGHAGDH